MGAMQILVVTTSSRIAHREVLERSILSVHPEADIVQMWCDERLTSVPGDDVVLPHGADLGGLRFADLALAHGARTAGWASMPSVVRRLRSTRSTAVEPLLVLDDTFVVLDRLDDLFASAAVEPVVRAGRVGADGASWGAPLPGAVVLPAHVDDYLDWWAARSAEAVTSGSGCHGTWWESRAGVAVTTNPMYRLTPSTAGELELTIDSDGRLRVDGRAPALVDFGGFDPSAPWWFAAPDRAPTLLASDSPGLRRLCHEQARRLLDMGWRPGCDDDPDEVVPGIALTSAVRSWYSGLLAARDDATLPPNPYVPGQVGAFVDLLGGAGDHDGTGVSVHADQIYAARADLQAAFPRPRWRDRADFRRWIWTSGLTEGETALATLPELPRPSPRVQVRDERRPFGVNLIGYMDADLGLGVAARQMQRALEAAAVPTATISYDRTSSNLRAHSAGPTSRPYHFNLMLIVPDQLPLFVGDVGPDFLEGHHNIGLWYWESDTLTAHQEMAFDHVDEVWAATAYLRDAFATPDRVPVSLVPSPLVFPQPDPAPGERARLGLDDRFTFMFSFDFLSVVLRKNPLGLVEAYCRAFDANDGARLILKSINGDVFPRERERLLDAAADREDIEVWDRLLPGADRLALLAAADCYVSLHRSEGLGLTMAEAMAVGTPVIATAYSGNLDFMDEHSALLVPAREVIVGPGRYYPENGHWADPDLDLAAQHMRQIRGDSDLRARLTDAGRRALEPFSHERVGEIARNRLVEAWRD